MADEADRAASLMEWEDELRRRTRTKEPALPPRGTCYNCEADVAHPKLFCDSECAEDFAFFQRAMERNGRG